MNANKFAGLCCGKVMMWFISLFVLYVPIVSCVHFYPNWYMIAVIWLACGLITFLCCLPFGRKEMTLNISLVIIFSGYAFLFYAFTTYIGHSFINLIKTIKGEK